jgi:hypothetical protein
MAGLLGENIPRQFLKSNAIACHGEKWLYRMLMDRL